MRLWLPFLLLAAAGCATGSLPGPSDLAQTDTSSEARRLLDRAIAARGGNPFELHEDLAVRYEGRWGRLAPRIQPVVADSGHRSRSEERLLLDERVDGQRHEGPDGTKWVSSDAEGASVRFSDRPATDEDDRAAAMVADAYRLFLLGAAFVDRHAVELSAPGPQTIDGRTLDRVEASIRPGFGHAAEDRVRLWLDRESGLLFRVLLSLEGFETTRGAEVDVTFDGWTEAHGLLWPTAFRERIRAPVRAFAHEWSLTGLDVDRGLRPADLSIDGWSDRAARPATPIDLSPTTETR